MLHRLLLLCSCFLLACSQPSRTPAEQSVSETKAPEASLSSKLLTNQPVNINGELHYAVYYPSGFSTEKKLPVMIFFDPHGDPTIPLNKYKDVADKYGFILIGSHDSKNGNPAGETVKIIDGLYNQARALPGVDTALIYCGGFSGGGRIAAMMGLSPIRIQGILTCGAGVSGGAWYGVPPYVVISMAGSGDMNLHEIKAFSTPKKDLMTRYFKVVFEGKHEWPPVKEMEFAFITFKRMAMRDGKQIRDEAFIKSSGNWLLDYLETKTDILSKADANFNIIRNSESLEDISALEKSYEQILKSTPYLDARRKDKKLDEEEESMKARLLAEFYIKDTLWWKTTFNSLLDTSGFRNDKARIAMIRRVQGHLSLSVYTVLTRAIAALKTDQEVYLSSLYRYIDPVNAEAWYLSAVVAMQIGQADNALACLDKSVSLGFKDIGRCRSEQQFNILQNDSRFQSILSKIN